MSLQEKTMVTIRDISLKCGVSVSTVSKVLNGYREIGEETKNRVLRVAEEMGYVPNAYARQLKLKKSYNIGVLFDTLAAYGLKNEYFAYILEHCKYRDFDGVCIVCADFTNPEVIEIINSDFPVVTIDHSFSNAISIISDNAKGMRKLTEYIISKGHKKIAYIHGTKSTVTHNRLASFNQVLMEHNIQIPDNFYKQSEYRSDSLAEEFANELLDLSDRPTCIVAPDDYAALGVIKAIKRRGLNMPKDISVAGYDGISISQALEPKLTTIRQNTDKIGELAAVKLINLMENPMATMIEHVTMDVELYEGESIHDMN